MSCNTFVDKLDELILLADEATSSSTCAGADLLLRRFDTRTEQPRGLWSKKSDAIEQCVIRIVRTRSL